MAPVFEFLTCSATVFPASTVPLVGTPASLDWQPLRAPPKLYENGCVLEFSPGEKFAVPCNWQPPTDDANAEARPDLAECRAVQQDRLPVGAPVRQQRAFDFRSAERAPVSGTMRR